MEVDLKTKNLENYCVVDKAETCVSALDSCFQLTDAKMRTIKKALQDKPGEAAVNGNQIILISKKKGKIVFVWQESRSHGKNRVGVLSASWNPQTWFSGQNVLPTTKKNGSMLLGLADVVEYPFKELFKVAGLESSAVDGNVYWSRLDFVTYTPEIVDPYSILKMLAVCCGGRLFSAEDEEYVGVSQDLGFTFDCYKSERTDKVCGVVFKKKAAGSRNTTFRLSKYLKSEEVDSRLEKLRSTEKIPATLKANSESVHLVEGRIRVEGQIYPDTFLRGNADPFRKIFKDYGTKKDDSFYRRSKFLRASGADEDTLKKTLAEMSRQLGLPIICSMPTKKTLLGLISSIADEYEDSEVAETLASWVAENLVVKPRSKTSAVYRFLEQVRIRTSLDMTTAKPSTATLIRNMVKLSTLSRSELIAFTEGDESLRAVMRERAKKLRGEFIGSCRFLVYNRS